MPFTALERFYKNTRQIYTFLLQNIILSREVKRGKELEEQNKRKAWRCLCVFVTRPCFFRKFDDGAKRKTTRCIRGFCYGKAVL